MKNIVRLMAVLLFCSMISSCSTFQNITVFGEPGTEIYTPDLEKVGTIKRDGKGEITLPRDGYYPFLLSGNGGTDMKIPFALDNKNRSYTGARVLSCVEAAIAGAGAVSLIVTTTACLVSGEDGESLGIAPLMGAGGVGFLGASFGGLATTNRLAETQREWQFEYLSKQSTNQDLRFEKFIDYGYRKEIGGKAVSADENVTKSSRKVEFAQNESSSSVAKSHSSRSKRTLTDFAKLVEGTYIGSGKLLLKDEIVESYRDIRVVLKRLDKNTVQVDVYESNGEAYFSGSSKYGVKKLDSGKYNLTMNGIPSATITIDADNEMVYLHPKVNIDGDLYTLKIYATKKPQANDVHETSIESVQMGIVGREPVKSESASLDTTEESEVVITINGQDIVSRFNDLDNEESGSWAPLKDANKVGFSLVLAPTVSKYLDAGGSKSEISTYDALMINNLNTLQSEMTFGKEGEKYSIVMEIVLADEDDAELRGWAYLYDNNTLEKLASSKIKAEGGRGATFNLRLEKSLRKAAKSLISVIHVKNRGDRKSK